MTTSDKTADDNPNNKHQESPFSTLVISLAASAMYHLGEIPDPNGHEQKVNVPLARHAIDTLAVLQQKTTGNLTKEEESLLERLLFDLRLKFASKVSTKSRQ